MDMVLIGLAAGLVVGTVVGLVGAGGAIIAVPALVYVVGLSPEEAVPTSLIVVGLASIAGAIPRLRSEVSWPLVLIIGLAGVPASWAGAAVGSLLDPDWLMLLFAAIMIVAGLRMLSRSASSGRPTTHRERSWSALALRGIPTGLAVGFLTGLLGVGGGFLIIPALTLLLGLPISRAVGTSLVIISINSASGFAAHLEGLSIDWALTASFAAAAMAASLTAARTAHRLDDAVVSRVFAVMIFAVALAVLLQTVPALLRQEPAPPPEAPAPQAQPSGISASLTVSRLSIGERSVNLVISNGTETDLEITAAALDSPWYTAPAPWVPADGDGTTVRPGGRVALPAGLPAAVCPGGADPSRADGSGDNAASVRLTLGDGSTHTVAAPDPYASLAGVHGQDCLQQSMDEVAVIALPAGLRISEDGRSAVISVAVTPAGGQGALTVDTIGTTTLITEAPGKPWPRQVEISGSDAPSVLELHIVPMRCDVHALAEDKVGTRLPLEIHAGGYRGQVRLEPPREFTAAVYEFVRSACTQ
ncbi:sulfite exporter TauE/SafE family protein [Arthrobacter sp. Sa2BUA2]|uniref:Probable membrane transporter protein n=1 Tax=Arthrobacter pullicola TaxID=2762224 RepID=A0ABR8YLK6_9MICC|nr:sulfite exporter TauE/SafE family protein [Arthrobacter pullicola]MBD8045094.1 sulfite exporter TauE/SafE family protein [Arthrobacter pullicola]